MLIHAIADIELAGATRRASDTCCIATFHHVFWLFLKSFSCSEGALITTCGTTSMILTVTFCMFGPYTVSSFSERGSRYVHGG